MSEKSDSDPMLMTIACFKLAKSLLFICAGVGVLHFLNRDAEAWLQGFLDNLHVDSGNHIAQAILDQVAKVTDTKYKVAGLSAIAFFYAILFGVEGTGLFLRKRWAEWFVVIVTSTLLPVEAYEIWHKVSAVKIVLTIGNLLILAYLIVVIRRKQKD